MTIRIALYAAALLLSSLLAASCAERDGDRAAAERGQRLMAQYQCGSCHRIPDVPAARGGVGPPLDRFGERSYIAGHLPNSAPVLARWIADPQALVPGTVMPDMGVTELHARDMAAYLMSLK